LGAYNDSPYPKLDLMNLEEGAKRKGRKGKKGKRKEEKEGKGEKGKNPHPTPVPEINSWLWPCWQ